QRTHRRCSPSSTPLAGDALCCPVAAAPVRSWRKRCLLSLLPLSAPLFPRTSGNERAGRNEQGVPFMTQRQLSLLPFYAGWGRYQQRLVAAIAPLTVDQLALRNTPRHWSIGMYATHIVANRAWWFHARMGEGGEDLTSLELWALGVCEADVDPCHTAAELVAG